MIQSQSHKDFVKKYKRKRYEILFCQILLILIFLGCWEMGTRQGWLNGFIFSSPSRIFHTACEMTKNGLLLYHISVTLFETLGSFALITVISIVVAMLLWWFPALFDILEPFFILLNSLPKSALAPILIVWLGNNQTTIVITAISIAVFGSIINIHTGFSDIDQDQIKLIRILGGNHLQCLRYVVVPGSIPLILCTMKVNIGLSLVGVIIGEFLAAKAGLGYLIIYGSQVFKLDWVMLSIFMLCIMAMVLFAIVRKIEKTVCKYM